MRGRPRRPRSAWLIAFALPFLVGWSFFDPFHAHVEKGNVNAKKGDATKAVGEYDEAARERPSSPIPDFNKGVALARAGQADAAREAMLAASASEDHAVAADALYNLGNVFVGEQHPKEAIESYLKSLDLDPNDADARRNLEIALGKLEQQQQQQKKEPQEEQKKDEDKDKKDQKPVPKDDSQNKEPQTEPEQQEQQPEPSPGDSTQAQEDRLTREDAERLLNAIQSDEMKVLGQVRRQDDPKEVPTHDW